MSQCVTLAKAWDVRGGGHLWNLALKQTIQPVVILGVLQFALNLAGFYVVGLVIGMVCLPCLLPRSAPPLPVYHPFTYDPDPSSPCTSLAPGHQALTKWSRTSRKALGGRIKGPEGRPEVRHRHIIGTTARDSSQAANPTPL